MERSTFHTLCTLPDSWAGQHKAIRRFVSRIIVVESGCWLWTGARRERGYGRVRWEGRIRSAHHIALYLRTGVMATDRDLVLHRCDEPSCVNPDHLYIGTQRDNMRDRFARGRAPKQKDISANQARAWNRMEEEQIGAS